ncbi:OB-fold putative lipoprotein [Caballeronia sp. INDeC2]|uniref:OB-fold putative lipoprotein n=1 Tax=Caballeronia sp. INDeC2 TaxID=2921747 RepID=UPI0020288B6D|nr:OB-fold putative lipoprotein [Caballeronia sp. INDeC2]
MKQVALAIAIAVTSAPVMAQQNPIAGLLGAVQSLAHTLGGGASPQNSSDTAQPGNLDAIVTTYAQDAQGSGMNVYIACSPVTNQTIESGTNAALAKMRLGDYALASASLRLNAEWLASQAAGPKPCVSTASVYSRMGQLLALSALAARNGGLSTDATNIDARNALALLQSDPANNKQLIDQLGSSGLVGSVNATAPATESVSMSASDAVTRYKQNTFGFNTKYSGKVLRMNGKVQSIVGSGQTAVVTLVGHTPKNIDDQGFQDLVRCDIGDPSSLSAAADLVKGQATTLSGLYKPDSQALKIGIELQSCRIVR